MSKFNWWMVAVLTLAAVVVLLLGANLLPNGESITWESSQDTTNWETRSADGSWQPWEPIFELLWSLLWLGCMIMGFVWMVRRMFAPPGQGTEWPVAAPTLRTEPQGEACAECGRTVEAEWQACPYCGHKLA